MPAKILPTNAEIDLAVPPGASPATRPDRALLNAALRDVSEATNARLAGVRRRSIVEFGAVPAGRNVNVTQNTIALQEAVTECLATGEEVVIPHNTAFDPSGVNWLVSNVHLTVGIQGQVFPATTWVTRSQMTIRGLGGNFIGVQHQIARPGTIQRPTGLLPTQATMATSASDIGNQPNQLWEGLTVYGGAGIAIHVRCTPNVIFRNVAGQSLNQQDPTYPTSTDTAIALLVSDTYWLWCYDCTFLTEPDGFASIYLTNIDPGGNDSGGQVYDGLRTGGAPVRIGGFIRSIGALYFRHFTSEFARDSLIRVESDGNLSLLDMHDCNQADPPGGLPLGLIENYGRIQRLNVTGYSGGFVGDFGTSTVLIYGNAPESVNSTGANIAVVSPTTGEVSFPLRGLTTTDSELEAVDAWRGLGNGLMMLKQYKHLPVAQSGWTKGASITVTPGVADPVGGTGATLAERATTGSREGLLLYSQIIPGLVENDYLLCGVWLAAAPNSGHTAPLEYSFSGVGSGWLANGSSNHWPGNIASISVPSRGWVPMVRLIKVTKEAGGLAVAPAFNFSVAFTTAGQAVKIFAPFIIHIPAAVGATTYRELARLASTVTWGDQLLAPGEVSLPRWATFRPRAAVNAMDLPTADPGIIGRLWVDPAAGNVVKRSEGVAPLYNVDFAAGAALPAGFTHTRATVAWRRNNTGVWESVASGVLRYHHSTTGAPLGILIEETRTSRALWNRDLTDVAWTKSNVTAAMNATGITGGAATASTLTATAANGTCIQPITASSTAYVFHPWVRRKTGTGTVEITINDGAAWTNITSLINSSTYTQVIVTATLVDPKVGFRFGTSGDAIEVDFAGLTSGTFATSPIETTTASVVRNADVIVGIGGTTYPANWSARFDGVIPPFNVGRTLLGNMTGTAYQFYVPNGNSRALHRCWRR